MQIPAKAEYALRALLELARTGEPATAESVAHAQDLPPKYLAAILNDLRRAGFIANRRTHHHGYELTRPADRITVAEVMRSVDGSLVEVRGRPPELATYEGAATHLQDVWIAARTALSIVFESVTLDQIATGQLAEPIARLAAGDGPALFETPDPALSERRLNMT